MPADKDKLDLGILSADIGDFANISGLAHPDLINRRHAHMGGAPLMYSDPIWIQRGEGVWVYDEAGRRYLDCYNNVPCVGHCNPRVVDALSRQSSQLNINSRYLHNLIVEYAEELTASFPQGLDHCFFVCTGSEANDLAVRMARAVTGANGVVVMSHAYHGATTLAYELSTMFSGTEGGPDHVAQVEPPDLFRGSYRAGEAEVGKKYAAFVDGAIQSLEERGQGCAAFLCDPLFDSQGGLEAPADYLQQVYQRVRKAGGLCIADEVQGGFARTGILWSFERYGVVPDIVTLGKPMGNGHPLAAVVTTRDIAERFSSSAFYGNTFAGNPVSAAVGKAVLEEIHSRDLVTHAARTGEYLRQRLVWLQSRHELIGNIRGFGLYQGVELVSDRGSLQPAKEQARAVPEAMKERGVLIGLTGRHNNVLKIRPPLVFDKDNVDELIAALDEVLTTTTVG